MSISVALRTNRQKWMYGGLAVAVALMLYACVRLVTADSWDLDHLVKPRQPTSSAPRAQLSHLLKQLGPPPDLGIFSADGEHIYTDYPSEQICIFVSDNRPIWTPDEMGLNDPTFIRYKTPENEFSPMNGFSTAFWLNKMWTIRHGYKFTKMDGEHVEGRSKYWNKVAAIKRMVGDTDCAYSVYMDSDVYVRAQEYSLLDMRKRWGLHDGILISLAADATSVYGGWNTGFMIFKHAPATTQFVDDWIKCPDEVADCKRFANGHPGDQAAFDFFILPKIKAAGAFTGIPCNEATGNTQMADWGKNCSGTIVTHNWWHGRTVLAQEALSLSAYWALSLIDKIDSLDAL